MSSNRLPIPPLEQTLAVYHKSLLALDKEATVDSTHLDVLQERLKAYDQTQPFSWLESMWLKGAYHSWREPLLVHSNWFMCLNGPSQPTHASGFTEFQIHRAACLVSNMLRYKDLIDRDLIEQERTKQGPLCMDQYKRMFGVTRIPLPHCDRNDYAANSKHICVLIREHVWIVDVLDHVTQERLPVQAIQRALQFCVDSTRGEAFPAGRLTTTHRDEWAQY